MRTPVARLAAIGVAVGMAVAGTVTATADPRLQPAAATQTDAEEDEYQGLPPGTGRDEVFGLCGACHSLRLVTQQGLSRLSWGDVLVYMVDEHEMPELEPEDEKLVLDYLTRFYGPDRRALRQVR